MDELLSHLADRPHVLISTGRGLALGSAVAVVVGLFGLVARTGVSAILGMGQPTSTISPSLSDLYPSLWTWWIPETILGAVPYLLLAAVGIKLVLVGRRFRRLFH